MPRPAKPPRRRLRRVEEVSAGGLVVDSVGPEPNGVVIGRIGRNGGLLWSLPKGHVEEGETDVAAAEREVAEETGIRGRVLKPLGDIDFWFVADDRRIHKTVHHFLLLAEGGELSEADIEVSAVRWVPVSELLDTLAYADERELVRRVPELLADSA